MNEFHCSIRRTGPKEEVTIVDLSGGIFVSNLMTFKEMLEDLVARRVNKLVLNFSELNFISSPAIGAILEAHGLLTRLGGRLVIIGVSPEINNILQFLAFHKLIEVMENEQSALLHFQQPAQTERRRESP